MAEMEFELSFGLIYSLNKKGHLTNFLGHKWLNNSTKVLSLPGIVTGAVGTKRGNTEFSPSRAYGSLQEAEQIRMYSNYRVIKTK